MSSQALGNDSSFLLGACESRGSGESRDIHLKCVLILASRIEGCTIRASDDWTGLRGLVSFTPGCNSLYLHVLPLETYLLDPLYPESPYENPSLK